MSNQESGSNPTAASKAEAEHAQRHDPPPTHKVNLITNILVVLYMIPAVGFMLYGAIKGNDMMLYGNLFLMLSLLIVKASAVLVWRITRRSNKAYNVAFSIGILVWAFATYVIPFVGTSFSWPSGRPLMRLAQEYGKADLEILRAPPTNAGAVSPSGLGGLAAALDQIVENSGGDDERICEAIEKVIREMAGLRAERDNIESRFFQAGSVNVDKLDTPEKVNRQIELLHELIACQKAVVDFGITVPILTELDKLATPRHITDKIRGDMKLCLEVSAAEQITRINLDKFSKCRDYLELHRRQIPVSGNPWLDSGQGRAAAAQLKNEIIRLVERKQGHLQTLFAKSPG